MADLRSDRGNAVPGDSAGDRACDAGDEQEGPKSVFVGDTVWAVAEVTDVRPTSTHGRAVVSSHVEIFNQEDEAVVTYDIKPMVAGRPQSDCGELKKRGDPTILRG